MESSTNATPGSSAAKPPVRNLHIGEAQEDVLDRPFNLSLWLRLHGVDLLTMAVVAAVCLGVHFAGAFNLGPISLKICDDVCVDPVPRQLFPIYNLDGSLVYPHLAYPRRTQIIPIWASAMIAILAPFLFISLFQWRRRSIDDALTTFMGVFKSELFSSLPFLHGCDGHSRCLDRIRLTSYFQNPHWWTTTALLLCMPTKSGARSPSIIAIHFEQHPPHV
jgi:hypothetical protein